MDPDATWSEIQEAVDADDYARASELAADLLAWMQRGGFPPRVTGAAAAGRWDTIVATCVCRGLLQSTTCDDDA